MKITYVSHATLLLETDRLKIVTDPWIKGAVYCNQWHLFPKPIHPEAIYDADVVLYSHGHEDHMHLASLQTIQKKAKIFYPYSWYGGAVGFFNELGFKAAKEVSSERTVQLNSDTKVTYLANNLDTILVIEHKDIVIVNVNDALPSASQSVIDYFIKTIKSRWPKIDFVFSSHGGAAYFPNTVHYEHKNDLEIAEVRELFFLNNFCRIVEALNPKVAMPFATDFVLLDDNQRWINETKYPRNKIKAYYQTYTKGQSSVEIIEAYPGDYFMDGVFHKVSAFHNLHSAENMLSSVDTVFKEEVAAKRNPKGLSAEAYKLLMEKIKHHIVQMQRLIPEDIRKNIKFAIKLIDAPAPNILQVNFRDAENLFVISTIQDKDLDLLIELKSSTIEYSIANEWGGDAIIIGYGAEVYVYNEDAIVYEYENYCIRLLSRYPNMKSYLKKTPLRGLKFLLSDGIIRKVLRNKILRTAAPAYQSYSKELTNRDLWLNKSKCDVCKACNIIAEPIE